MADVRISKHFSKTNNKDFTIIRFYDELENLIGTNYVILSADNNRLYFKPSEVKVKGSLKLGNLINAWRQCEEIAFFEGEYSLDFDTNTGMYYVDRDKRFEISRSYGNYNVPHNNYKPHANESYVEMNSEEGSLVTNSADLLITSLRVRKYSMTVYDGLLELLRVQISDLNKSAVKSTLNTIKSLIEDE